MYSNRNTVIYQLLLTFGVIVFGCWQRSIRLCVGCSTLPLTFVNFMLVESCGLFMEHACTFHDPPSF